MTGSNEKNERRAHPCTKNVQTEPGHGLRTRLCAATFHECKPGVYGGNLSCSHSHTLALWGKRWTVFGPKSDDFWPIGRYWGISLQRVYRNPRPTHIQGVMRRLREEVRNTDPKTLLKLVHEMPAKMNEIYRLKGAKIPSNFDARKSPFACKCSVCREIWKFYIILFSW